MSDFGWKVKLTFDTEFKISTCQKKSHLNALGSKFDLDVK